MTRDEAKAELAAVTFYGTGDESYEQWCDLCRMYSRLVYHGDDDRACVLMEWIKADAEASKMWYIDNYGSLDEAGTAVGQFDSEW